MTRKRRSDLEETFVAHWRILAKGWPAPEREFRFMRLGPPDFRQRYRTPTGKLKDWRFDFAWPSHLVAVEIEGGIFVRGGHNRGPIYDENCTKYNAACLLGWRLLRYTVVDLRRRPSEIIEEVTALLAPGPVVEADRQSDLFETF